MYQGVISYVAKIGDIERIEKDIYEGESLQEVFEAAYKAVMNNTGVEILEVHIYRNEQHKDNGTKP